MTTKNDNTKTAPALTAAAGAVFELVDCTNDENYFPMGLFLSLKDATK